MDKQKDISTYFEAKHKLNQNKKRLEILIKNLYNFDEDKMNSIIEQHEKKDEIDHNDPNRKKLFQEYYEKVKNISSEKLYPRVEEVITKTETPKVKSRRSNKIADSQTQITTTPKSDLEEIKELHNLMRISQETINKICK